MGRTCAGELATLGDSRSGWGSGQNPGQVLMVPQVKMLPGRSYGVMGCNGLQFNQGGPH